MVAHRMQKLKQPRYVTIPSSCGDVTPVIAPRLARTKAPIFIDTSLEGEPGRVTCLSITPEGSSEHSCSHTMNPELLLFFAKQLYGGAPKVWLLTVTGERFGYGEGLSESVVLAMDTMVQRAARITEYELGRDEVTNESE